MLHIKKPPIRRGRMGNRDGLPLPAHAPITYNYEKKVHFPQAFSAGETLCRCSKKGQRYSRRKCRLEVIFCNFLSKAVCRGCKTARKKGRIPAFEPCFSALRRPFARSIRRWWPLIAAATYGCTEFENVNFSGFGDKEVFQCRCLSGYVFLPKRSTGRLFAFGENYVGGNTIWIVDLF